MRSIKARDGKRGDGPGGGVDGQRRQTGMGWPLAPQMTGNVLLRNPLGRGVLRSC